MKKILFMVSSMNIGGIEKSLLSLLEKIPRDECEVTVLMLERRGGFLECLPNWVKIEEANWFEKIKPIIMQPPQQTVKDYYRTKQYTKIASFTANYIYSKWLDDRYVYYKQVFEEVPYNLNTYDLAIAYAGPTDVIDYYIANRVRAKKKLSWVHFDVSKHPINKKLYGKLYKAFDKIFVVSKEAKQKLLEHIPETKLKADVFLNIVPKNLIARMVKEEPHFGEGYRGTKIVTVGRLSKEKGQDIAVKALSLLRRDGYDVKWYCIGEGASRKEYEIMIDELGVKDHFILLGATANPYPYMKKADIYVQTSRHEGYCLTLAEAKCLHRPIITTNFTGAREQIKHGYNGYIVECNEMDLYKKVKYLLDNKLEQQRLNQNLMNDSFSKQEDIQGLLNLIL